MQEEALGSPLVVYDWGGGDGVRLHGVRLPQCDSPTVPWRKGSDARAVGLSYYGGRKNCMSAGFV